MGADRYRVILTADDAAITEGVSRAIRELAQARRISAASAMVTTAHWPAEAHRLAVLRDRIAVGLHFNLTLGRSLGTMARLAPTGAFPDISALVSAAVQASIDKSEIRAELDRQLDAFEAALGHPPDHVDGHQHAHALPGIGEVVAETVARRYRHLPPLVRNPADKLVRILRRHAAVPKALTIAWLSRGFARLLADWQLPTNDSFAGISGFAVGETAHDFERSRRAPGALHLIMCHPGYPDDELARIDKVLDRRLAELELLRSEGGFGCEIWRPERAANGPPVDWSALRGVAA